MQWRLLSPLLLRISLTRPGRRLLRRSCLICCTHAGTTVVLVLCPADCSASILYKTKLPFILVFNKIDVHPHSFALDWMHDFEVFQEALASHSGARDSEGEPTYMNSLMNSMSLVLDEFYKHLTVCFLVPDHAHCYLNF